MEFNEKLLELRKRKCLTQEELAEALFVSRTAVSKWESGRGFPNIESLKAISKYFGVSLDELLSGEDILVIAEKECDERETSVRDLLFGLFDCAMALLLFLPFFGLKQGDMIQPVSLIDLQDLKIYLKAAYFLFIGTTAGLGILTLALQNLHQGFWTRCKYGISLALSCFGVCLFIVSQQPYAAIFTFLFLVIKAILLIKRR